MATTYLTNYSTGKLLPGSRLGWLGTVSLIGIFAFFFGRNMTCLRRFGRLMRHRYRQAERPPTIKPSGILGSIGPLLVLIFGSHVDAAMAGGTTKIIVPKRAMEGIVFMEELRVWDLFHFIETALPPADIATHGLVAVAVIDVEITRHRGCFAFASAYLEGADHLTIFHRLHTLAVQVNKKPPVRAGAELLDQGLLQHPTPHTSYVLPVGADFDRA